MAPTSGCTAMETESSWLRLACAHMSGTRKTSPASCSHEARLGLGLGLGIGLGFGLGLGLGLGLAGLGFVRRGVTARVQRGEQPLVLVQGHPRPQHAMQREENLGEI